MISLPLEREAIFPRIDGIQKNIRKLRELGVLPFEEFRAGDAYDLAQHHLRLALEGVFHIGAHILSRLPGERATEYREIAIKLGEGGIVKRKFAEDVLVPMARMRNLLVHHYADVDAQRLYAVIRDHLSDIEEFLLVVKELCEHPEKHGLELV
ncbi:MAG: DUF86 domain-containing protein [Patescibacteria group bacterium]